MGVKLVAAFLLSLLLCGCAVAKPSEPHRPFLKWTDFYSGETVPAFAWGGGKPIFAEGRLWLVSEEGELFTITPGERNAVPQALPELVFDMCLEGESPVVVTGNPEKPDKVALRRWSNGTWTTDRTLNAEGDYFLALHCASEGPMILTSRRLINMGARQRVVKLSGSIGEGRAAVLYTTPDSLFVGLDGGEFGGGLRRIDRKTGRVTIIGRRATKGRCSGPLNIDCDPVHGLARAPWNPRCIAATIGLQHGMSHGRVIDICGTSIRSIYLKPDPQRPDVAWVINADKEPVESVAFYGLTRVGDTLWAASPDGLIQIKQPGAAIDIPLPKFEQIGPFRVSFELPAVALIRDVGYEGHLSPPVIVPR